MNPVSEGLVQGKSTKMFIFLEKQRLGFWQ
jgi:hypothetical protein